MEPALESPRRKRLGRSIGIATVGLAAVLLLVILQQTKKHPRTDDANVRGILYLPNSALFLSSVTSLSGYRLRRRLQLTAKLPC